MDVTDQTHPAKKWRVGVFVTVDVEAYDEIGAWAVAEAACGWPGDWRPPHPPAAVSGELNGKPVSALITRSQTLTVQRHPGDLEERRV